MLMHYRYDQPVGNVFRVEARNSLSIVQYLQAHCCIVSISIEKVED